jgi:hypothetical protein
MWNVGVVEFLESVFEVSMDIVGIREALHKQPFQPFLIRLADGGHCPYRIPTLSRFIREGLSSLRKTLHGRSWNRF